MPKKTGKRIAQKVSKKVAEYSSFEQKALERKFSEIEKLLMKKSMFYEIEYEKKKTDLNFAKLNEEFINAIKCGHAVYCIWLKQAPKDDFTLVYIGHAKDPKARLKAHLSKKNEKTGACLKKVQEEVSKGATISVSFVKINSAYMRAAVEEWLIGKYSKPGLLAWNRNGKKTKS